MSISVPFYSQFYYGYEITAEPYNGFIDVDEGAGELSIEVPVGSYTLTELAAAIRNALNTQGTLDYSVVIDRASRHFTISANSAFDILISTGIHSGNGIYSLLGLPSGADLTGLLTYFSTTPSGACYRPQFLLQSYVGPDDWQQRNEAAVNVSASGSQVEVVNFGIAKFAQFDIKFITDKKMDGSVIKNNQSGVQDARDFMQSITSKSFFEFMPSINAPDVFYKVLLESTTDYNDGTGYKLKELWDQGLPGIFETGVLKVRVLE